MSSLRLAVLSLLRRKFSTAIAVMAIAIAVACSGILLRLYELSESRFSSMGATGDAIVGAKAGGIEILLGSANAEGEFPDFLPFKLFETLRSEQTVHFEDGAAAKPSYLASIIPFVYFAKYNDKYNEFRVIGTDETFLKRPHAEDSLSFSDGRWASGIHEVVLGSSVAASENLKVGDKIKTTPWLGTEFKSDPYELTVVGILSPTKTMWDRSLFSNLNEAQNVFMMHEYSLRERSIWGPQVLHYFLVYLNPDGYQPLKQLINQRTVGQVVQVSQEKQHLQELTGVGKSVGLFVTVLVLLLGGLSVCSMLVTRFEGMTVQLAMLRALGYTHSEVSKWLLWEGLILGVLGCAIGAVFDAIGLPMVRTLLGEALPPVDLVGSSIFASSPIWIIAILAIILSVLIPLARLYRQDIHSALRGV